MADPFEVRMRFSSQLQHLSASVTAAQKAASFALKNREMDEDLHSCILEQLERNSMNTRANIMYFLDHLCDLSLRENHPEYIRMLQRDILRVIDAVAPPDGTGAANIRVVRRVLSSLQAKSVLQPETVQELEAVLKSRDIGSHVYGVNNNGSGLAGDEEGEGIANGGARRNGSGRLEKRQIEQRIEEDRERHKRAREVIWAVSDEPDGDGEMRRLWDEGSDIGDDDYLRGVEDEGERKQAVELGPW